MAKAQSQFALPSSGAVDNFGFDNFGGYSDLGGKPDLLTPAPKPKSMSKTALKAKPQLPKDNFLKKYEKFGRNFELDVFNTIQKDINEMEDRKKQETLKTQEELKQKAANDTRKRHLKQMSDILDAYYEWKKQTLAKEQ